MSCDSQFVAGFRLQSKGLLPRHPAALSSPPGLSFATALRWSSPKVSVPGATTGHFERSAIDPKTDPRESEFEPPGSQTLLCWALGPGFDPMESVFGRVILIDPRANGQRTLSMLQVPSHKRESGCRRNSSEPCRKRSNGRTGRGTSWRLTPYKSV